MQGEDQMLAVKPPPSEVDQFQQKRKNREQQEHHRRQPTQGIAHEVTQRCGALFARARLQQPLDGPATRHPVRHHQIDVALRKDELRGAVPIFDSDQRVRWKHGELVPLPPKLPYPAFESRILNQAITLAIDRFAQGLKVSGLAYYDATDAICDCRERVEHPTTPFPPCRKLDQGGVDLGDPRGGCPLTRWLLRPHAAGHEALHFIDGVENGEQKEEQQRGGEVEPKWAEVPHAAAIEICQCQPPGVDE